MATTLNDAVDQFQMELAHLAGMAEMDIANLWASYVAPNITGIWDTADRQLAIDLLAAQLPGVMDSHILATTDASQLWYDELAPAEPFFPEALPVAQLLPGERIVKSVSWAMNTAITPATALSQLQGSMQRAVYDASRDTVVYNAKKEGVKYVRHANYAGACNWCLVLATKGAVYKSAAAAMQGHDNCKCFAVPLRAGQTYNVPPKVKQAAENYEKAVKSLNEEGKMANLDNIVKKMDEIDAETVAKATAKANPPTDFDKLPPTQKKTVQNSYQGKKNKAKAKFGEASEEYTSLKALGAQGYYELHYKDTLAAKAAADTAVSNVKDEAALAAAAAAEKATQDKLLADYLLAEAKYNAEQAAKPVNPFAAAQTSYQALKIAEELAEKQAAAKAVPPVSAPVGYAMDAVPDTGNLKHLGGAGGSHGAEKWVDPAGQVYIMKTQGHYKNLLDSSTAELQKETGLGSPNVWVTEKNGQEVSLQEYLPGGNAFTKQIIDATDLKAGDQLELQKSQVFDWLIANHDTHAQQWVRDADGKLVGIDKGQAFKWFGKDKLDWDFHPNKASNEHEPIYNTIWQLGLQGKLSVLDPSVGELNAYIQGVQAISDDQIRALFKPFAEAAAKNGKLTSATDGHGLLKKGKVPDNDVDAFLSMVVARKNNLQNDFDALYAKYKTQKTGVSPTATPPSPLPGKTPTVDMQHAIQVQHNTLGELIVNAHAYAKQNNFSMAEAQINAAKIVNGMTTEEFVGSPAAAKLGKQPVAPAAKLLQQYQYDLAQHLSTLLDQGAIDVYNLAQPGHIAGVAAQKFKVAAEMTPTEYAAKFPEAVAAAANPLPPTLAKTADYAKLPPAQKKTVQNSYAGKKNKAKVKYGETSPEYLELKAMGPDGYYANVYAVNKPAAAVPPPTAPLADWEQELLAEAAKPTGPVALTEPMTVAHLAQEFDALDKASQTKVGNQFSGKKNKAKTAPATDPDAKAKAWAYSQWSKKDFWASQQIAPGGPVPHPYAELNPTQLTNLQANEYTQAKQLHDEWMATHPNAVPADSPLYGVEHKLKWMNAAEYKAWMIDNGVTSMLGSPLGVVPKIPGVKIPTVKPPANPPTDPVKLGNIAKMQSDYFAAKPGGTGFNPVKAFEPNGTLKTNIEPFSAQIGVGYLTDDQLYQVLIKLPNMQQTKYLNAYADAKGQAASDAVMKKLYPNGKPSVVSPPTSAGSKPAQPQYGANWKASVNLKAGTTHTPDRVNALGVVKSLATPNTGVNHAIPDINAPVGSAANPHVFDPQDNEYKVFGALHTDQIKTHWDQNLLKPIEAYTGSSYGNYNEKLREDLAKMIDDWLDPDTGKPKLGSNGKPLPKPKPSPTLQKFDKAFEAETTQTTEEWVILSRSTSRREFSDNDVEGLGPFKTGGHNGTVAELKALEGHTYIQRGIGSTSLSASPAGMTGKHVRVIYRIPPKTKMVYVDGEPGTYNRLTSVQGEREVLLPRDSRYKVLEVRDSTHGSYNIDVIVELVAQET